MAEIQVQLASLSDTVIAPVYSWVTQYKNFIDTSGSWKTTCGSDRAAVLDFDSQIREFVKIRVESDCCQHYGICGEQFVSDIVFDDNGKVTATRFRF
jgi:Niemann-Pick C1 protein